MSDDDNKNPPPEDPAQQAFADAERKRGAAVAAKRHKTSRPEAHVAVDNTKWESELIHGRYGELRPELLNAYLILTHEPAWHGVVAMDEFAHRIVKLKPPPTERGETGEWTETDDSATHIWIAKRYGVDISTPTIREALQLVARRNGFHPVREYLINVAKPAYLARHAKEPEGNWADWWLLNYLGASWGGDAKVKRYIERVSRLWLIALVARVMQPGCKADYALILEGQQGLGKSSALAILGGTWFSDTPFVMGDKDSYEGLRGIWVKEIAELDAFNKAENTRAKAFLSSPVDWFRPPYGHRHQAFLRQCLFAGTTNQNEYFRDSTGNRRYWPVYCSWFEREMFIEDRDVILGHALALYEAHVAEPANADYHWWPQVDDLELMRAQQARREIFDPWEEAIAGWLYAPEVTLREQVTTTEILTECLKLDLGRIDERGMATRVGRCMRKLRWERCEAGTREERRRSRFFYRRPSAEEQRSVPKEAE